MHGVLQDISDQRADAAQTGWYPVPELHRRRLRRIRDASRTLPDVLLPVAARGNDA
jgi:hypothetical protein